MITIKDGKLLKDGKDLKLRGINYADVYYLRPLKGRRWKVLDAILSTNGGDPINPRVNAVRVMINLRHRHFYEGKIETSYWYTSIADIKALIAKCKGNGVTVTLVARETSLGGHKITGDSYEHLPSTMEATAKEWVKLYNGVAQGPDSDGNPESGNSPLEGTEGNVMINLGNEPIVPLNADTWETDWAEQRKKVDDLRFKQKEPKKKLVDSTLKELKKAAPLQEYRAIEAKLKNTTNYFLETDEDGKTLWKVLLEALEKVSSAEAKKKEDELKVFTNEEEKVKKAANDAIEKLLTRDWGVWKDQMIRAMDILNNGFEEGSYYYKGIPHHIIVVDGPSYSGKPLELDEDGQTTIDAWNQVIKRRSDKVMASVHMYDHFQTKERVYSTLDAFRKSNIPVMVGEFGLHKISEGDQETIIRIDAHAIMKKCEDEGIPYLAWSWLTGFNKYGKGQHDDGTAMMKHPGWKKERVLVNYPPSWPNDKKERASDLHTNFGLTVLAQMHQGGLIAHESYGWSYKLQRWTASRFILKGEDGKYVKKATPEELTKDFVRLKPNQTLVWKVPGFVDHEQYMRLNYRAASKVRIDFDGSWNRDSYFVIEPTFYDNKLDWSRMDRGQSWIKRKLKNNAPLPLKVRPPVWNEVYITNISDPSSVTTVSSLDGPPGVGEIDIKELYVNYWNPN